MFKKNRKPEADGLRRGRANFQQKIMRDRKRTRVSLTGHTHVTIKILLNLTYQIYFMPGDKNWKQTQEKKIGHNEIVALCAELLVTEGLFNSKSEITMKPWDSVIFEFAKENDEKEVSADILKAKFKVIIKNQQSENIESKEDISLIVKTLKSATEELTALDQNDIFPPRDLEDIEKNKANRIKKAELVINLSDKIDEELKTLKYGDGQKNALLQMQQDLKSLASGAKYALKQEGTLQLALIEELFTPLGSKTGDKNNLEKIMEQIEAVQ